jgi:hypothetical protein
MVLDRKIPIWPQSRTRLKLDDLDFVRDAVGGHPIARVETLSLDITDLSIILRRVHPATVALFCQWLRNQVSFS